MTTLVHFVPHTNFFKSLGAPILRLDKFGDIWAGCRRNENLFWDFSSLLDNVVGKSNDFIGAFFLGLMAISRTVPLIIRLLHVTWFNVFFVSFFSLLPGKADKARLYWLASLPSSDKKQRYKRWRFLYKSLLTYISIIPIFTGNCCLECSVRRSEKIK